MNTSVVSDRTFGLKYGELTSRIIKTFYDVYNELGPGFLESVYEHSMLYALSDAGLSARRQVPIPVNFRGRIVGEFFADLVVNDVVVLEIKTARTIDRAHEAQLLHYLKATDFELGLILNFGPRPQLRRLILDNEQKQFCPLPVDDSGDPWQSVVNSAWGLNEDWLRLGFARI